MMRTLDLKSELYSLGNVKRAALAYGGVAKIMVRERGDYIQATFLFCRYNEDQTVHEFENYLIGLENSNYAIA